MTLQRIWMGMVWTLVSLGLVPQAASAAEKAIVVGQAIDLSGPNGSIGRDYVAGITTYFDSVNVKGGINGRKIRYLVRDDRGEAAESARMASELIKQDHVDYLMGGIGTDATQAIVAAPAFLESKHVLFAPLADSVASPRSRVLFWRPGIESELRFLLDYFDKLGVKQVGIALQENAQTRSAYQFALAEIKRRGMTLAVTAKVAPDSAGLDAETRRMAAAHPRLVLAIADTIGTARFLKSFRLLDPATFVAGTSLTNLASLAEIAGARGTDFTVFSQVVPNPAINATPLQAEHIDMMRKFRDEPLSALTLEGFAVAKTLGKAIQGEGGGLQGMLSAGAKYELGGITVLSADATHNMSRFVEIALFKKGGGLIY